MTRATGSPVLPQIRRRRSELASVAGLDEYVDVDRVRDLIESPSSRVSVPSVENCFMLATWLRSGRESARRPRSEETNNAAQHTAP